jgi:hypothetical protein
MTTKEEAIASMGEALAEAYELLETLPIEEAARIAYTPTGPSMEELVRRITARRDRQRRKSA